MSKKRILVVSPHPDDETLGVGGTIAKYSSEGHEVNVLTISGHLPPLYKREDYEITLSESRLAFKVLGVTKSVFLELPATMIGNIPIHELNSKILKIVDDFKPHIVFCPYPDRHVDHRLVFESVMVATRPVGISRNIEIIAAYETLSETHWNAPHIEPNFIPNWVIDISKNIKKKMEALKCYQSQIPDFPGPRSIEAVEALAKFRGTQAGFGYGEGMHIIRMVS
ncbi:PIG-L family deacetylase [Alphaproteobacteria bacterium]|nr:PIG-L family deacetylase [Alphaproteobacteria bacterium]